jgi:predicted MPP superfamily phosphohydrolase
MTQDSSPDPEQPRMPARRRLLMAGAFAAAGIGLDALGLEPQEVLVTRTALPVPGLDAAFQGMTIAQVSDVHLPGNHRAARHALTLLKREKPDVVLCTGDLVENRESLGMLSEFVGQARGSLATVGIFGNWERMAQLTDQELAAAYRAGGGLLLQDARLVLRQGSGRLGIAGLGDALYREPSLGPEVLDPDLSDADIWMVHCPAYAERLPSSIPRLPAALLSGHTHGGQIRLPGWVPYRPVGSGRFIEGWYRDTRAPLYVSRGVGTVEIQARFCCPPEIPIFTLQRG